LNTTSSSAAIFLGLAIVALSLPLYAVRPAAQENAQQAFEAVEAHMGTLFRIKLYAVSAAQAQNGFRTAFDRISQLDDELSDYKSASELSRLSHAPIGQPVVASDDLFRVLAAAQQLAAETEGAFDVTLGPVIRLWRAARKAGEPPDAETLRKAGLRCGYRKLKVDVLHHTVELDQEDMQLDLGGIAKGFAADEALAVLRNAGISSALVAASGDLTFSDAPPGKAGWTIGVDSLDEAHAPFTRVLVLANGAISTSGDTEQFLYAGGKRYSHIIDPKTNLGLTNRVTATVIAPSGIVADSAATTICVLGDSQGLRYVDSHPDLAALLVLRSRTPPVVLQSQNFARLATDPGMHGTRARSVGLH
jgi:thiamine biosynthesis lipoprotein